MARFGILCGIGLLWTVGGGCSGLEDPRHSELMALSDSVEIALQSLNTPPSDDAIAAFEWANNQYREFELLLQDSLVTVTKEEGEIISTVARARRLLKDQASRRQTLPNSAQRAVFQLRNLAQAIGSGATVDAAGNTIDAAYIHREMATESQIAREVILALQETQSLAQRGMDLNASIASASDSLQTLCRGRLAQAIINANSSTP